MMVPIFLAMKYFNYSAHIAFFEAMRLHIYRLQCRVNVTFICTRKQILRVPRFIMMLTLLPGLDPNCGISGVCVHLLLAQLLCVCVVPFKYKDGPRHRHAHPPVHSPCPRTALPPPSIRSRPHVVPSSRLCPLPKLTKSGLPTPGATAHERGIGIVPSLRGARGAWAVLSPGGGDERWH